MAVTEVLRALGGWSAQLNSSVPMEVWNDLDYFGHVAIHASRVDVGVAGDSLLESAKYVGVLRRRTHETPFVLSGPGMAMWLGDEDHKGDVLETVFSAANEPFHTLIPQLLPVGGAVVPGTIFNIGENFSGSFQFQTPRQMIDYVAQTLDADWRVNGDGTLDAGLEADLFVTDPVVAVLRRNTGTDMAIRGLLGQMSIEQDVEDFTTRVTLLTNDDVGAIAIGEADILPGLNPYKDIHGNVVKMTRLVTESETSSGNADARAQLQLNRFTGTRDALTLSTSEYDVKGIAGAQGSVSTGDYLWVWDPEMDLEDFDNEITFFGIRMNPIKLRLTEITWPVTRGMSVAYRDWQGKWTDLSDYLEGETGDTTLVVGGYRRSLTDPGDGGVFPVTPPSGPNTTVPGAPTWVQPFAQSTYQSLITGEIKAQVGLEWLQPNNTDASNITDGDHYEIRYRTATAPLFPVTHAQLAAFTHAQLAVNGTAGQPLQFTQTEWQMQYAAFDELQVVIAELAANMAYEAQIRAVDNGQPANAGAWSILATWQTLQDTIAPATPAPPEVAASTIAVQVKHELGKASGGTFNLERDLHHLEIHGGPEPLFATTDATLLGKLIANWAMIVGEVPVVQTFPIKEIVPVYFKVVAVDNAGNKSQPSLGVQETADLVDDAHISNLTVSKLTAGTMTASYIHAGWMRVGAGDAGSGTGPAIEITPGSIQAISPAGALVLDVQATTGQMRVFGDGGLQVLGAGGLKVAGGGSFTVHDGNVVERLRVATSDVTIRDAAGNEVFSNESGQGWGITQPNLQTAFYPVNSDAASQNNTNDSNFYAKLVAGHIINHPVVHFGIIAQSSGATGFWRVTWFPNYPSSGANPANGTIMGSGTIAGFASGSYTFPSDMFGELIYVAYMVSMNSGTSGVNWVSSFPTYFYGAGS